MCACPPTPLNDLPARNSCPSNQIVHPPVQRWQLEARDLLGRCEGKALGKPGAVGSGSGREEVMQTPAAHPSHGGLRQVLKWQSARSRYSRYGARAEMGMSS